MTTPGPTILALADLAREMEAALSNARAAVHHADMVAKVARESMDSIEETYEALKTVIAAERRREMRL